MRPDPPPSTAASKPRQRGFVLVVVLLISGIVATTALVLVNRTRGAAIEAAAAIEVAEARALADAGLTRLIRALRTRNDPLLDAILASDAPVPWRFAGAEIALSIEQESGKLDLNQGNPELAAALLAAADLDPQLRDRVAARLSAARAAREPIPGVAALLTPCERLTPALPRLEALFTVLTRNRGLAPGATSDERLRLIPTLTPQDIETIRTRLAAGLMPLEDPTLAHLAPYLSDDLPIHRLSAQATATGGAIVAREAIILLVSRAPFLRLLSVRDLPTPADIACD